MPLSTLPTAWRAGGTVECVGESEGSEGKEKASYWRKEEGSR